jgi:hypothetical protein
MTTLALPISRTIVNVELSLQDKGLCKVYLTSVINLKKPA